MIFVTVGTQLTFDRLVSSVDDWASKNLEHTIVVQTGVSNFKPKFCETREYLEAYEWEELFNDAELIIAHAGMGTILKCLDANKPLIIMPRQASMGEHRNDHQLATASKFRNIHGIFVVDDKNSMSNAIKTMLNNDQSFEQLKPDNLELLLRELRDYVKISG